MTHQAPRDQTEIELCRIWQTILHEQVTDIDANFFLDLGGTSHAAVQLLIRVEESFGSNLRVAQIMSAPTVRTLAELLTDESAQERTYARFSGPLVRIQDGFEHSSVYFFHPLPGTLMSYFELIRALGPVRTLIGLQALGIEQATLPLNSIDEMSDVYLSYMLRQHDGGPWRLFGYSMGGYLAVEVARKLKAEGETVALVCAFDSGLAAAPTAVDLDSARTLILRQLASKMLAISIEEGFLEQLPYQERIAVVIKRALDHGSLANEAHINRFLRFLEVRIRNFVAAERYDASAFYHGKLSLIRASDSPTIGTDDCNGWSRAVSHVDVYESPGDHDTMLSRPHVEHLAGIVEGLLA